MKVEVSEYEKKHEFELEPVTQLCGQNIPIKAYIFESLRRYFGTYKYSEIKNKWRDNVWIDDAQVGRKYFSVISIKNTSDILSAIKCTKQSLMLEYVNGIMQKFDWQEHLNIIGEEVEEMFQLLNEEISSIGSIELTYSTAEMWDMVQKTDVTGKNETTLEDMNLSELFSIFLNLIEKVLGFNPQKTLILIENADHFLSPSEYRRAIYRMQEICCNYDAYFALTTSLDGYAVCDEELCSGIAVFNDASFQFPQMSEFTKAINDNYPCNKEFDACKFKAVIEKIVQRIGKERYLNTVEENAVLKIINRSLMFNDKWDKEENAPEIAFLKA